MFRDVQNMYKACKIEAIINQVAYPLLWAEPMRKSNRNPYLILVSIPF